MEARLTENVSLKAEYRYTDLGKQKLSGEFDELRVDNFTEPYSFNAAVLA